MRKYNWPGILVFSLVLGVINVNEGLFASSLERDSILTIKKCQDFKITGKGSSDIWNNTGWINLEQRRQNPPVYKTKVKVLYSETGMYFLFDCEDKRLTSSFNADNLDLWKGDVVEVFLWTDDRFPIYFEYELSPLNYELPMLTPNFNGTFYGWLPWHYEGDRKIQHATSVAGGKKKSGSTISGWTAEFFIPFKVFAPLNNVPPISGTRWRANMYRIDRDNDTVNYVWQWQFTEGTFHEPSKFGTFIFE